MEKERSGKVGHLPPPPQFPCPDKPLPTAIITSPPTWLSLQFHTQLPQLKSEYKPRNVMPHPGISSQYFDYYEVLVNSLVGFVGSAIEEGFAILQVLHGADLGGASGCSDSEGAMTRISRKKKNTRTREDRLRKGGGCALRLLLTPSTSEFFSFDFGFQFHSIYPGYWLKILCSVHDQSLENNHANYW